MLIFISIVFVFSSFVDGVVSIVNDGFILYVYLFSVKVDIVNGFVVDGWINCICKIIVVFIFEVWEWGFYLVFKFFFGFKIWVEEEGIFKDVMCS